MLLDDDNGDPRLIAVDILVRVGNVQEVVVLVVLTVERAHCGRCGWDDVVHKEEQGILGTQVNSLTDQEIELAYGQVSGYQVLLLVQVTDARLRCLLHNHLMAVVVVQGQRGAATRGFKDTHTDSSQQQENNGKG